MLTVVIPCYREPDVLQTLQSLARCDRGDFRTVVVVVVNTYKIDSPATAELNRLTYKQISDYAIDSMAGNFCIMPRLDENLPGHQTGAGIPRRIGMDIAVECMATNPCGIIVSLDADCTVSNNYLTEIYRNFREHNLNSATLAFHHPVEHLEPDSLLRRAAEQYETYLRYFRCGLQYAGYPYPFFTIGSAFAVTVETYLKVGRMGRQQSGEDFYFLQKVFPLGRSRYIDTATVFPAARPSDRVPFGTGPALRRMLEAGNPVRMTYQAEAFRTLKSFFARIDSFYRQAGADTILNLSDLPSYILQFLEDDGFADKLDEINRHTASPTAFRKRFFDWFNAFRIIKYMNFVHPAHLPLSPVEKEFFLINSYIDD
jgi:glycosyltransferase involved in cell wall biosynthesis